MGITPPIVIKVKGTDITIHTPIVAIIDNTDLRNMEILVLSPS
jgi:hypothetical protein